MLYKLTSAGAHPMD